MHLKEIGEFGFIHRFATRFDELIKKNEKGIGDDCAVFEANEQENYLVTTDLLVEDIHFLRTKISAYELGQKSLAINLSDIAGMGGTPLFSFLSLGIPDNLEISYLDSFMEGFYQLSSQHKVPLMGGDTTKSPDKLIINVAVIGICKKEETRLRSMAQESDIICVTGNLGNSAGGLKVLLDNLDLSEENKQLVGFHHNPIAQVAEGKFLARQMSVHAMMDISDGISSDLEHILKASGKSAVVFLENLPINQGLKNVAKKQTWNLLELAVSGGEDYELLFTMQANDFERLNIDFFKQFKKNIVKIGEIRKGNAKIKWLLHDREIPFFSKGFDHFKTENR